MKANAANSASTKLVTAAIQSATTPASSFTAPTELAIDASPVRIHAA